MITVTEIDIGSSVMSNARSLLLWLVVNYYYYEWKLDALQSRNCFLTQLLLPVQFEHLKGSIDS